MDEKMVQEVPSSIRTALLKVQERIYLLYLEKELIKFINGVIMGVNEDRLQYLIKVHYLKNSYYRLLSHQLCQYYNLHHQNNQFKEILVTMIDNFDYQLFMNSKFIKLSELARKYQQNFEITEKPKVIIKHDKLKIMVKNSVNENSPKIILKTKATSPSVVSASCDEICRQVSSDEISKIEIERASKEALYLKIRQQIFDAEQQDQDDDNENDDENDDEDDEEGDDEDDDEDDDNDNDDNDNDQESPEFSFNEEDNDTDETTLTDKSLSLNYYMNAAYPPIPMAYSPIPQQFRTYPSEFYPQYPQPIQNNWFPPYYDKETERRLLNNPYIILPDNRDDYRKKQHKKVHNYNPSTYPRCNGLQKPPN